MIDHNNKCLFVHVPKAAGTSIESYFVNQNKLDWENRAQLLIKSNNQSNLGPPCLSHLKLHEYKFYNYLSSILFKNYFKFTFVRNPWSRAVSFYKYGSYNYKTTFKKFIKTTLIKLVKEKHYFYAPQYDFIYHENETEIDFVGHFENLDDDFKLICKKIDIVYSKLPHKNNRNTTSPKSFAKRVIRKPSSFFILGGDEIKSSDYKKYYDIELINIIQDLYQKDVDAFGYDFENTKKEFNKLTNSIL